ncbi:hypothetical protein [Chitinophaga solisilvae]|uniref:Uncharacterized protein n=1 Tax=Chitinophaga solisilvae TaxID=1233460 RepID=A0A433WDM3_9BACT|nr:hypothetical protein [Chitinophaga solisilvae]NSL86092.1 hypothetical protein [Chitinophaga solisilvae]
METKSVKHFIYSLCLTALAGILFTGCGGKKDDPAPQNYGKISLKITVTVTGADQMDQVDLGISAGNHDASQYGEPVWKINGVTQGNENVILWDEKKFFGSTKTYVFETVRPYNFGGLSVSYSNQEGTPITLSYKAEVDGKVETNVQNQVIAVGQSQSHNYKYTAK